MTDSPRTPRTPRAADRMNLQPAKNIRSGQTGGALPASGASAPSGPEVQRVVHFLQEIFSEVENGIEPSTTNPHLNMLLHLLHCHFEGRVVSPSAIVAASGVPYATGTRKLADIVDAGFIEQRPRTKSGKITELAVRDIVHGREVKNKEALANPEALDLYRDIPALRS